MRRLRILTWHVHGSYLYYLSRLPHDIYLPVKDPPEPGYYGRTPAYDWPANIKPVPAGEVAHGAFDLILFQAAKHWLEDQYEILTPAQRRLPRIFLEHDPPREHPTDSRHPVDDPNVLLVHVTPFNALMWDSGRTPVRVIDHGVEVPEGLKATGELPRGVAVINNIARRGRRLGYDVYLEARDRLPLDLFGMGWREAGGSGELPFRELHQTLTRYRFFFNPIRYTSLGLAVLEAMALGLPVVGLATAELATVIENDVSGYVDTDPKRVIAYGEELLRSPTLAQRLGEGARKTARERFGIARFIRDWQSVLAEAMGWSPSHGRVERVTCASP